MILTLIHWACRLFLTAVFLYSGIVKLQQPLQFAVALAGYQLLPEQFILPISNLFPWVEVLLGVTILTGWKIRYSATFATGLLLFFSLLLTITYLRGIDANCGCFSFDDPISPMTIIRDGLIVIPAIFLMAENRIRKLCTKGSPS